MEYLRFYTFTFSVNGVSFYMQILTVSIQTKGVLKLTEQNLLDSPEIRHIHFIGIGGISMSGLAEILLSQGYIISGSDLKSSNITERLSKLGANIYIGQSGENIKSPDLVVYTAAVKADNPELVMAKDLKIISIERSTLLGLMMKRYKFNINISGTHGKTTTTSMVTMIMLESESDPTVHIGGELAAIGGNTRIGSSKYFIAEACEYVESFLQFHPYLAIILNIEADHLDYFKDIDHIKESFLKYTSLIPDDGYVIACIDDENTASILDKIRCNKITYGIKSENANWKAKDISFDERGYASFTLLKDDMEITRIELNVTGIHNVYNAVAAAAACYTLGCSPEFIKSGLAKFIGTRRRFEVKGVKKDICVVDDYAHHPSEITATLKAAKNISHNKIWCVFQPHTYTRTKALLNDFAHAFQDADTVIVSDIYAARETDKGEIHSKTLTDRINETSSNAVYMSGFEQIADFIKDNASAGDLILTMGAGDIYRVGEIILDKM